MNPLVATLVYEPTIVRCAVNLFLQRRLLPWLLVGTAALGVPFAYALALHDRSWLIGVLGTALFTLWLLAAALRRAWLRQTFDRVRRLDGGALELEIGDDELRFRSSSGEVRVPGASVVEVWKARGFWLLFREANDFVTLPVAALDAEQLHALARVLAAAKCVDVGG